MSLASFKHILPLKSDVTTNNRCTSKYKTELGFVTLVSARCFTHCGCNDRNRTKYNYKNLQLLLNEEKTVRHFL